MNLGSSRPEGLPYPPDFPMVYLPLREAQERIPNYHPEPWPWYSGVVSCPTFDYYPHLVKGRARVVREPIGVAPRPDLATTYLEDKGPLALGIVLRESVLIGVNHHHPRDLPLINICDSPGVVTTISGGKARDCAMLLQDLQTKCDVHQNNNQGDISVGVVLSLMMDTLSSRAEVGLIAGWDDITDCPALYRVDGFQGVIKGEILASGEGFRELYSLLDLNGQLNLHRNHAKCNLDNVVAYPSRQEYYQSWSFWSVGEASKMVRKGICQVAAGAMHGGDFSSVFSVRRDRVEHVCRGEPIKYVMEEFDVFDPGRPQVVNATDAIDDLEGLKNRIQTFLASYPN